MIETINQNPALYRDGAWIRSLLSSDLFRPNFLFTSATADWEAAKVVIRCVNLTPVTSRYTCIAAHRTVG